MFTSKKKERIKMAPKEKSGKKKDVRFAGDPITVGGGGSRKRRTNNPVYITFSGAAYEDQNPQSQGKTFKHKTADMTSLVVSINGTPITLTSLIPCNVTITCNTKGQVITISGKGNKNQVTLHTGKYPLKTVDLYECADLTNFIHRIKVRSNTGRLFDSGDLAATDKVEIKADTQ